MEFEKSLLDAKNRLRDLESIQDKRNTPEWNKVAGEALDDMYEQWHITDIKPNECRQLYDLWLKVFRTVESPEFRLYMKHNQDMRDCDWSLALGCLVGWAARLEDHKEFLKLIKRYRKDLKQYSLDVVLDTVSGDTLTPKRFSMLKSAVRYFPQVAPNVLFSEAYRLDSPALIKFLLKKAKKRRQKRGEVDKIEIPPCCIRCLTYHVAGQLSVEIRPHSDSRCLIAERE